MNQADTLEEILQCFDDQGNPTHGEPRSKIKTSPGIYNFGVSNIWVVNKQGQLLCSRRSFAKTNPGKWQSYFGGHLPVGMTFKQNAVKELREEAGITVSEDELFLIAKGQYSSDRKFFQNFVVLYSNDTIDLSKTDGEIIEVRWMNMDDYWQEQESNPEIWCHRCKPEDQKLILEWLNK